MIVFSVQAYCIEKDSVLSHFLEDIVITSEKTSSSLKNSDIRAIKLDMEFMHRMPKIFGNADPLHYTQMLPGIQTNAEYYAGVHIQGCDNSHNMISIEGIPVYNASHLLGFFSTFIPSHFSGMSITKNATAGEGYSRIGGLIDMELNNDIPERTKGEFSAGLISTQGTIRIPFGKKAALFTSLRISYLNLIYSPLLKIDDGQLKYSFGDMNVTYLQKIGKRHTVHIDFYSGIDKAKYENPRKSIYSDNNTSWGNSLAAIHWSYKFKDGNLKQSVYFSGYRNRLSFNGDYKLNLPSEIYDIGYRAKVTLHKWEAGLSLTNHNIKPQVPEFENKVLVSNGEIERQRTLEGNLFAAYKGKIVKDIYYDIALKGDLYSDMQGYTYTALNPYATLAYDARKFGRMEISYSHQHQYLLNCGFTNMGMPVEFWIGANADNRPQYTHNFQFGYRKEFFKGKFEICMEAYYKRLYNQVEYNGTPLDILNKEYSVENLLLCGKGYNYGTNIMLNKLTGKLTGWLSYSFGRAMRQFDIYGDRWFPANHERIHEVNVVAAYRIGKDFDIGATFSYASGTPFTSVKYIYLMNNNILAEFGEHNANRLKDYIRLDLSANYDILRKDDRCAGINISIYNVLCRKNEIYYGLRMSKNGFKFRGISFLTNILPSISFYYKF